MRRGHIGQSFHNINIIKLLSKILYILLLNHLFLHHVFVFYYLGSSDKTLQIVDMRVKSYNKYLYDASTLTVPMARPQQASYKTKTLES